MKKSFTVSSQGNSREFEKNASNQGKIGEFVWPKGESGRFTQACGEERMSKGRREAIICLRYYCTY